MGTQLDYGPADATSWFIISEVGDFVEVDYGHRTRGHDWKLKKDEK